MTTWTGGAAVVAPRARRHVDLALPRPGAVLPALVAVVATAALVLAVIVLCTLVFAAGTHPSGPTRTGLPTAVPGAPPEP